MKKAVLREDMMAITNDVTQAMVLGQMMYWTKTLDKVNDWLFEENKRLAESNLPQHEYNYGWIWKSAKEMREDLMFAFSEDSIRRAFTALVNKGVLMKRNNPYVGYDRKLHYRIDLLLLRRILKDSGFEMTDFQLAPIPHEAASIPPGAESIPHGAVAITEINNIEIKTESNPQTPLQGVKETSAMASSSLRKRSENSPQNKSREKTKRQPKLADQPFLDNLRENNPRVDFDTELRKMDNWLLAHQGRQRTRAFVTNWINRVVDKLPPEDEWRPTTI